MRSTSDGEISFFSEGLNSNVVAEIKLMGDSLTWFGTGRGLSMYDGQNAFTYQSTNDSIVDVFSNPSSTTNILPSGGVSAIAISNDTLLVAFAGDDNNTPLGLGFALATNANSWYDTEPDEITNFNFSWDSLGSDISSGIYFGFDSQYEPGLGYTGSFLIISPSSELDKIAIYDSIQTNTVIKITNADLSKTLRFTVESVSDFGVGQIQLLIVPGSITYNNIADIGFLESEPIKFSISPSGPIRFFFYF